MSRRNVKAEIVPIKRGKLDPHKNIPHTILRRGKGRPRKKISLADITKKFMAGCTVSEAQAAQGINNKQMVDFIFEQCEGMLPSDYRQLCLSAGNATLREVQYDKAVAGDNTMLIFLGKDRLGQSDRRDLNIHVDLLSDFVNKPGRSLLGEGQTIEDWEDRALKEA